MSTGITLQSATDAVRIATGDEDAHVACIVMRTGHVSMSGQVDGQHVEAAGADIDDCYVAFIVSARRVQAS